MARGGRTYAKGRRAWGECQRSGKRLLLRDMVEDGHVPGLLVAPDWWEPRHPQEIPPDLSDPIALYRPAPEISIPEGYGDPEAGGAGACALTPDTDTYLPSTTLDQAMAIGSTLAPLADAVKYSFGQCIYIQRDDGTWFVSKSTSASASPTYTVPLTTGVTAGAGPSGFSAGNSVYIGVDGGDGGGGNPVPVPVPDGFIMVLTELTNSERPNVIISEDDIEVWTEGQFIAATPPPGNQIADRNGLVYDGVDTWVSVGSYVGTAVNSGPIWYSQNDGATWINSSPGSPLTRIMYDVLWTGLFFTCVGEDGTQRTVMDPASTWSVLTPSVVTSLVAISRSSFNVATGDNGAIVVGANQVDQDKDPPVPTVGYTANTINSARIFVATATGRVFFTDDIIPSSPDWTESDVSLDGSVWDMANDGDGTVVAVGESRNVLVSTNNGASFTLLSNVLPAGGKLYGVVYDQGVTEPYGFIAVGAHDAEGSRFAAVYTSPDGLTWTNRFVSSDAGAAATAVYGKNTL